MRASFLQTVSNLQAVSKSSLSLFTLAALAAAPITIAQSASAYHPHKTDAEEEDVKTESQSRWPNFGKKTDKSDEDKADSPLGVTTKTMKKDGETVEILQFDGDELTSAAKDLEEALSESGILSSMAAMLAEFADNVEVQSGDKSGTALFFDGEELMRFKIDGEKAENTRMLISGLGRNLDIERETFQRDGETKTRIVIEMDGGEDVDIELPDLDLPDASQMRKKADRLKRLD